MVSDGSGAAENGSAESGSAEHRANDSGQVRTLTIRRVPEECVVVLKQAAKDNNRSMESQMRSVIEEWTASYVAHEEMKTTNFAQEMRDFMAEMGIDGFDNEEFPIPDRRAEEQRDIEFVDWADTEEADGRSAEGGASA
ncbi:FitA-like ribbon-helix-helix domain-containing protein [Bifidobacterium simiarum]|uniref:FitA-like ribbon-helix-helix domain-containing protein n=1 Tax=Bifidobacterium simiarum TaxID=2045441 RepID=UPI001FAF3C73|nr:hypothetical protein [Bifidobacterium simiarum]